MGDIWVVNASPLICLGRVGHLDLLAKLADEFHIVPAVAREVLCVDDAASELVLDCAAVRRVDEVELDERVTSWRLGDGETEVLSYALSRGDCDVVLDDGRARRCATALGIPLRGTLGVALVAKDRGLIAAARPIAEALCTADMRLHPDVLRDALARVGE